LFGIGSAYVVLMALASNYLTIAPAHRSRAILSRGLITPLITAVTHQANKLTAGSRPLATFSTSI
jgi:hypothetical protein